MTSFGQSKGISLVSRLAKIPISRLIHKMSHNNSLQNLEGLLTIKFPTGQVVDIGNGNTTKLEPATVNIKSIRALSRMANRGSLGFAESYIRGEIDTPDLKPVFHFIIKNRPSIQFGIPELFKVYKTSKLYHKLRKNTRRGSQKNIFEHYDLGNDFYSSWLDESMTYSSAYFLPESNKLHDAQVNKYQRICEHVDIEEAGSVLEIGCGWGGFAEHVAKSSKAKVTAISISNAQLEYARQRIKQEELAQKVDFKFLDYRDTSGKYDAIVSIEMIEAVGEEYWPVFFRTLKDRLAESGTILLQAITIDEEIFKSYRKSVDFIQRYIFPGGMLLTEEQVVRQAKRVGLQLVHAEKFPHFYARTLAMWHDRFNDAWDSILALGFDEKFRRKWNYYLKYCQAGFEAETISVGHFKIKHDN